MNKILLTPLRLEDVSEVHSLWSDEEATLFTNFPYIPDLGGCKARLIKMLDFYSQLPHFGPYAIRAEDGTFLGLTGGDVSNPDGQIYEIWYFIRRNFWGRKVATKAVQDLLSKMTESGRVQKIKAETVVNNEPSWKFLETLGFERKELVPNSHQKNGQTYDRYVYFK